MGILTVNSFEEFEKHVGEVIGISPYLKITQEQINTFADATLDHQWIHTDPERAEKEGQFGTTIAHGYLMLSLVPYHWNQIIKVNNLKMMINYGIESLKFNQPVRVNDEVRMMAILKSAVNLRGTVKVEVVTTMEIKDNPKPVFTATILFLYHFL